MNDSAILALVKKYRRVLLDANILLLYIVGKTDPTQIPIFKKTADRFVADDFDTLLSVLAVFQKIVTTPYILTEVSNLSGQGGARSESFHKTIAAEVEIFVEEHFETVVVARTDPFVKLGLTDAAILQLRKDHLVLTDDRKLAGFLEKAGVPVFNFNHIRAYGWKD